MPSAGIVSDSLIESLDDGSAWTDIGPVAALVVALAAGVTGEAARRSTDTWVGASAALAQATALRRRAIRLAREDREAHLTASEALEAARQDQGGPARGGTPLAAALARAADLPLEIAEAATDAAALAALVAEEGIPDQRADAAGAALLAAGAVAAEAELIAVNLSTSKDDERLIRVDELRITADAAAERARAAGA